MEVSVFAGISYIHVEEMARKLCGMETEVPMPASQTFKL